MQVVDALYAEMVFLEELDHFVKDLEYLLVILLVGQCHRR